MTGVPSYPRRLLITRRAFVGSAACAATVASVAGNLRAQEKFPSRPIEVVTHAGVGGGTDITARMMMVEAPGKLGTELVVVNRVGGSGAAALAYAATRPRDGHTILLITQTHLLTILRSKAPPVAYEEIVALARATEDPQILMVGAKSPYKSAKEFLDASKGARHEVWHDANRRRRPHRRAWLWAAGGRADAGCRAVPRRRRYRDQPRRREYRRRPAQPCGSGIAAQVGRGSSTPDRLSAARKLPARRADGGRDRNPGELFDGPRICNAARNARGPDQDPWKTAC